MRGGCREARATPAGAPRVALIAAVLAALFGAGAALFPARRLRVEGLSMLPGLEPGSVVQIGWREWRAARGALRRFDRWVVHAPDGGLAVKRLVGLPGERIELRDGDLFVDGRPLPAPPPVLGQLAVAVPAVEERLAATAVRCAAVGPVHDDCPWAAGERRLLLPVPDGGAWGTVRGADAGGGWWLSLAIGGRRLTWRLRHGGAVAVVGGRFDGRLVASAWGVAPGAERPLGQSPWPRGIPAEWQVCLPWEEGAAEAGPFAAMLEVGGAADAAVLAGGLWRDVLYRPGARGETAWILGAESVWLLGDSPATSLDCRQWGPLDRSRLVAPIAVE
jgi:type IV secretory pathway protease TraF